MPRTHVTYTERMSVYMRGEHRAQLQNALPAAVGVGAALRDAGLRAAGRVDLILESRDESGHRKPPPSEPPEKVAVALRLTREQQAVLNAYAKKQGRALSTVLVDALREELGLEPIEPAGELGGWTRGQRRSRKPPKK